MMLKEILLILSGYPSIVALVGAAMGGEGALLFLSTLAGQGAISFIEVVVFFYIGSMIMDLVAFGFSKTVIVEKLAKKGFIEKFYSTVRKMIGKFQERVFIILLITKFLYGTRYITIAYLGLKKISFKKFLFYDLIITIFWMGIIVPIGWLAGKGIGIFIDVFHNFQLALSLIIAFIFVVLFIRRVIIRKILD